MLAATWTAIGILAASLSAMLAVFLQLSTSLNARIDSLRTDISAEIRELRADLQDHSGGHRRLR